MTTRPALAFAVTAALVALLALSGCETKVVTAPAGTPTNTVTSSGSGQAQAVPDVAIMTFGVTRNGPEAKQVLEQASQTAEEIVAALKDSGVADEDIQTSNVGLYPDTSDRGGKLEVVGYRANISVTAKVTEIDTLGEVITTANDAGADSIGGPSFSVSENSEYRDEAIAKAVEDARDAAAAMARAASKDVGDVLSMSSADVNVPAPLFRGDIALESAEGAVPIEPGQLDVNANVVVTFELE
jgi:uncharacterized protein YggE